MSIQLTLPPNLEESLRREAERCGQAPEAVVLRVLKQFLTATADKRREAGIAMLHKWMDEDAQAGDPKEADEFFRNLDAARTSNRPLFPPELKGISW